MTHLAKLEGRQRISLPARRNQALGARTKGGHATHGTNDSSRGGFPSTSLFPFPSPRRNGSSPVQSSTQHRTQPAGACGLLLAGPSQVAAACTADPSPPATCPGGRAGGTRWHGTGTPRPPPPRVAAPPHQPGRSTDLPCRVCPAPLVPAAASASLCACAAEIARGFSFHLRPMALALPSRRGRSRIKPKSFDSLHGAVRLGLYSPSVGLGESPQ
jgi:hypothetical protein